MFRWFGAASRHVANVAAAASAKSVATYSKTLPVHVPAKPTINLYFWQPHPRLPK